MSKPVIVDGWGTVGLLVEPDDRPPYIIPPIVFVDGELRQGVNVLAAIQATGLAMDVPRADLTDAQLAALEQVLAKVSDDLGGVVVHWDWTDDPADGDNPSPFGQR